MWCGTQGRAAVLRSDPLYLACPSFPSPLHTQGLFLCRGVGAALYNHRSTREAPHVEASENPGRKVTSREILVLRSRGSGDRAWKEVTEPSGKQSQPKCRARLSPGDPGPPGLQETPMTPAASEQETSKDPQGGGGGGGEVKGEEASRREGGREQTVVPPARWHGGVTNTIYTPSSAPKGARSSS